MLKRRRQSALSLKDLQSQTLQELGEYFFHCRQQQNLSLEQIAASTKIQRRLLEAIEKGDLDRLPESVYIRGLLSRFADAMGLPGRELAAKFPLELSHADSRFFINLPLGQLQPLHLYLLYIFLIFSAINGLSALMPRSSSSFATTNAPATEAALPVILDQDLYEGVSGSTESDRFFKSEFWSASALKSAFPLTQSLNMSPGQAFAVNQNLLRQLPKPLPQSSKPVQVSIQLKQQSWIKVFVDNEAQFEGILSDGATRTWTADQNVTIRAGNAGGVWAAFNGSAPKPLGEPGAVEEVIFEASSSPTNGRVARASL